MKIFKFFMPFIASILSSHSDFVAPKNNDVADSKNKTLIEGSNSFSQIILRKFDDAGRFLHFAKHSSHRSHSSHTSHNSESSYKSYKNSSNSSSSNSSSKRTRKETEKLKKITLKGSAISENKIQISWNCENIGNGKVIFYQNGEKTSSITSVQTTHLFSNLLPATSYTFYVEILESSTGKTYKSNTITIKTFPNS